MLSLNMALFLFFIWFLYLISHFYNCHLKNTFVFGNSIRKTSPVESVTSGKWLRLDIMNQNAFIVAAV